MRILVMAPHAYYIDRGSPIDVDVLVRALSERGDEVDLVVYSDGEDRAYPGLEIHRAATPRWLAGIGPGFSMRKVLADLWLLTAAWRLLRRRKYDVVHAGEEAVFIAMLFKFIYGLPYVYDMDSSIAQQIVEKMPWLRPLSWLLNWCEAKAVRHAAAAAPVCNALAEVASMHGAKGVTTLHDISQMTADQFKSNGELRRKLGIDGLVLMYVGNLEAYQGIDLLLESIPHVLAKNVNIDVVIAGGSRRDIRRYKSKAARLAISERTHFIGPWPAKRLGELLSQADILTAPRIKGINTPMKIFPYMHSGRPVLVTDLPTHTQILTDAVVELAPAEPRAFAASIVRLANDEARRKRLGSAGRRFVEQNHTFPAHRRRVDRLYEFIQSSLGGSAPPGPRAATKPHSAARREPAVKGAGS